MKEVKMPSMSPTMEEGKIVKWVIEEGEEVKRGDVLLEVETDKAAMEYESEEEGVVGKIIRGEGESVKVGEVIGLILERGEEASSLEDYEVEGEREGAEEVAGAVASAGETLSATNLSSTPVSSTLTDAPSGVSTRVFASPLARVIALQNNIDLKNVKGSGPRGRILKKDVLVAQSGADLTSSSLGGGSLGSPAGETPAFVDVPNSGMRKTIAKRLLESKTTIPHFYLNVECRVDELLKVRGNINALGKDKYKISINDFIIKAVGLAMKAVPEANSYWQGETTRQFTQQDVSVAVAIPNGLITPIIKNVAAKGLIEISAEMKELAARAKEGKLKPEEYQGGGFSISNLGMFGIDTFSAIVNPPQSGILAVGGINKKPAVVNDQIAVANILSITLSADHRVLDGSVAAIFLGKVKIYLENPASMLL